MVDINVKSTISDEEIEEDEKSDFSYTALLEEFVE